MLKLQTNPKQIANQIYSNIEPHIKEIISDMLYHETEPYLETVMEQTKINDTPLHMYLRQVTAQYGEYQREILGHIEFDIDSLVTEMFEHDKQENENTLKWG